MNVVYNAVSKILLYHYKNPKKLNKIFFLFKTTRVSAVNICGTTIHSGLRINSGTKLLGSKDKSKPALKSQRQNER